MKITLYSMLENKNKINKTLGNGVDIMGSFRGTVDILKPTIEITTENPINFNYCFIPLLNRYYFIDNIQVVRNNFYLLYLSVDVLKTYADKIKECRAVIVESENPNPNYYNAKMGETEKIINYDFADKFDHNGNLILITGSNDTPVISEV